MALLVARTRIQLSRLARWGAKRYDDWNGYYCNAQRFIRDVVQTDPDNLLRTRLTEQIRRFQSRPYGLVAVAPIPFLHLREVRRPVTAAPLAVPAEVLANRVLVEYTQPPPDRVQQAVAALVERLRTDGAIDLVAAARDVAPDFSDDECFQLLIRATPLLLKHGATPLSIHERPWIKLSERLHAQTMTVQVTGTACGAETNVIAEHPSPPFAWHEQGGTS